MRNLVGSISKNADWDNTPVCPHCGNAQKIYRYKNGKTFKCAHCKKQFTVKTSTIYENSNIPLLLLTI